MLNFEKENKDNLVKKKTTNRFVLLMFAFGEGEKGEK